MIVFPHAKINLGLHVVAKTRNTKRHTANTEHKRAKETNDGYHHLETILLPVGLQDALEVVPASDGVTRITVTGHTLPTCGTPNLCLQAYDLLNAEFGRRHQPPGNNSGLPPIHVYLHKCIPAGSGLGGGSSDAAFMLMLLNDFFELSLKNTQLENLAGQLGSDCPFFLKKKPMLATGQGNILHPIQIPALQNYRLVIIAPPIHINTASAYSNIKPRKPNISLTEVVAQPPDTWKDKLVNDFEESMFRIHPTIGEIKDSLFAHGAVYASMSGSGSSVYGLFPGPPPMHKLKKRFPASQVMFVGMDVF